MIPLSQKLYFKHILKDETFCEDSQVCVGIFKVGEDKSSSTAVSTVSSHHYRTSLPLSALPEVRLQGQECESSQLCVCVCLQCVCLLLFFVFFLKKFLHLNPDIVPTLASYEPNQIEAVISACKSKLPVFIWDVAAQ